MPRSLAAALVVAALSGASVALACSLAAAPEVPEGLLGFSWDSYHEAPTVPRNAATTSPGSLLVDGDASAPVAVVPVGGIDGLYRAGTLLPPGASVSPSAGTLGSSATVLDVIDEAAPSASTITGGAFTVSEPGGGCGAVSSCGTLVTLSVDVSPSLDDLTPANRMTYALFLGRTEEEASTATTPDGFFVRDWAGAVWRFADRAEGRHAIWAAVVPIDLAGNLGPRSEAVQIHHPGGGGCATSGGSGAPLGLPFALVLAWLAAGRLRRRAQSTPKSRRNSRH